MKIMRSFIHVALIKENSLKTEDVPRFFYYANNIGDAIFIKCYKKLKVYEYNCG